MNQILKNILDTLQQNRNLNSEEKDLLLKSLKAADKELEITAFKLERTEKVKKTTAILLEETIDELEQKRKAVEAQNHELEIEAALERVRAVAMSMSKSDDLLSICEISFKEFQKLGFDNLRNAIIHILNDEKRFFMDYDFSEVMGGSITKINYDSHPIVVDYLNQIKSAKDAFGEVIINSDQLNGWKEFRRKSGQRDDPRLNNIPALYYYFHSIGVGDIGISTFKTIDESQIKILKRFRNVFDLAYRRYNDIALAETQAREAQIQLALERIRARTMAMHKSDELSETSFVLFKQLEELGEVGEQISITVYNEKERIIELYATIYRNKWEETGKLPFEKNSVLRTIHKAWKEKEKSIVIDLSGEELDDFNEFKMKYSTQYKSEKELPKDRWVMHYAFFSKGALTLSTHEPRPAKTIQLLERFAGVFDLTYTRFLDLQKAEAQAREAQIEAALERIRSRVLGMHHSSEVGEVSNLLYTEFEKMNISLLGFNIIVQDKDKDRCEMWRAKQVAIPNEFESFSIEAMYNKLNHYIPEFTNKFESAWRNGKPYYIGEFKGKNRISLLKANREIYDYSDEQFQKMSDFYPDHILFHMIFFKQGWLGIFRNEFLSENDLVVSHRFAEVFEFAYTRFLDLQKAEAQAREAQIEAALERVRSKTMAMHNSDEVGETVVTLFDELVKLGLDELDRCGIGIMHDQYIMEAWTASKTDGTKAELVIGHIDMRQHALLQGTYEGWRDKKESFQYILEGDDKINYFNIINNQPNYKAKRDIATLPPKVVLTDFYFNEGCLYVFSSRELIPETAKIFARFAGVFGQTYRRYLDLQKAEAQAREAQIENALEKVRSRSLAMHKSNELKDVVTVLFEQLRELNLTMDTANIEIYRNGFRNFEMWVANADFTYPAPFDYVYFDDLVNNEIIHHKELAQINGEEIFTRVYPFEIKNKFWNYLFEHTMFRQLPDDRKNLILNANVWSVSCVYSKHSGIVLMNYSDKQHSQEELNILKRFSRVFEQAYIRFLDLQKAEEQAREAQIEAALERVRAKAMAMHSSNDISDTMGVVFTELPKLGISSLRCGVVLLTKDSYKGVFYAAATTDESDSHTVIGEGDMSAHPVFRKQREHWTRNENYFVTLSDEELKSYYKEIFRRSSTPYNPKEHEIQTEHGYYFSFSEGMFYAWSEEPYSESDINILNRFKGIIDLTFRRYFDLKKAEAQAREAIKQASLDRVRGEIASMRTAEDLNRITPIIWRELKNLEVPFIRCGVFIVNEEDAKTYVYLSTPDGKALGVLNLTFDANQLTNNTVEHWRKKQVYKEHWNKEEFISWTKSMMELGQVQNAETYQGSSTPPESLHLHLVPFTQGMLYVGDVNPLTDEKLDLVKTLAEAFSIAYARFEDFKNIEDAKNKIELTLSELKSTQAQLVHSEKMASLGELTAGIAHEIKNPLNFVNNFSEVSRELLDEMKTELQNKNEEEVAGLIEDLKQNLEKINQHGKRADSIVKGMLLHSRGTAGEKTLTDINDLLDQYVNLAYHGMRALNKEFNLTIEKDYDKTLEKISVVPQDISRVFLNIINNACYAAYDKKKKSNDNKFSPTLKVSTKNLDGKAEIRIADNGDGISKNILDKIFQPFFTTKPTGEGTGLGLSLSYDIVTKVHGGELKVKTKEEEGTEFIIHLPLN